MAANSLVHPAYYKRSSAFSRWLLKLRYPNLDWLPRRDLVLSLVLLLAGLSLPAGMVFGLLLASFPLAFLGFSLTALGGILLLIRCGEI